MQLIDRAKRTVRSRVSTRSWNRLSRLRWALVPVRTTPRHAQPVQAADPGRILSCLVAYNRYGGYCLPTASVGRPVPQAVVRGLVWEQATIDLIARHAGRGDVVHAGTYFGDFLPALSASVAEGARIWAFEPNRESYRCARITLLLNGIANVDLVNAAVGEAASSVRLVTRSWDGTEMGGLSRILQGDGGPAGANLGTDEVCVLSIDATVPSDRTVSIVHLDVEQYEQPALAGGLDTIRRCRPMLILETEPDPGWIDAHLAPLGYARRGYVDGNSVFAVRDL